MSADRVNMKIGTEIVTLTSDNDEIFDMKTKRHAGKIMQIYSSLM